MKTPKIPYLFSLNSAVLTLFTTALACPCLSAAITITLINPSFENAAVYNGGTSPSAALLGWTTLPESYGVTFNAVSNFTSGLSGSNVTRANGRFFQTTAETYVEGATYTVTVDVGRSSDFDPVPGDSGFTFGFKQDSGNGFRAGGDPFITGTTINTIPDKTFQTYTATYTATALDVGQPIIVGLDDYYQGTTYVLDNFTLTSSVPEPSSILMGFAALGLMARRRRLI